MVAVATVMKVVLLGEFGVGKSSYGLRVSQNRFEDTTVATIGVAHFSARVSGTRLELWDTAGQERYRSLDNMRLYLRQARGAVVVFDATSRSTFESAKKIVSQVRQLEPLASICLAANKCDLEKQVDIQEIEAYARDQQIDIFGYTSCKTGENVAQLMQELVAAMKATHASTDRSSKKNAAAAGHSIRMPRNPDENMFSCCSS